MEYTRSNMVRVLNISESGKYAIRLNLLGELKTMFNYITGAQVRTHNV